MVILIVQLWFLKLYLRIVRTWRYLNASFLSRLGRIFRVYGIEGTMSMTVNGAVLVLLALAFSTEAKLVNVTLYSEALCPDCADFVRTDLSRAVEEVSGSICYDNIWCADVNIHKTCMFSTLAY